ncbi:MAG: sugar transferase [Kofleriaceae bacterium]|nr:sugar transferase [Kofleriaceae bacterium]
MSDRSLKRLLDVSIAGVALMGAVPLLAMASVAIKLESRGPVLFAHTRVGRGKRPIQTLKLRTMRPNAEHLGPAITAAGDPRITRVGRLLRKTKLDELPQLWNVLRGDMSLVGPRPEVARYVEIYPSHADALFEVRPGLTDLASVTFRDEETLLARANDRERAYREVILPMKLALSLEGLERTSVSYDLAMLVRTVLAIVAGPSPREQSLLEEAVRRIDTLERPT